jgi:hypothetical protein
MIAAGGRRHPASRDAKAPVDVVALRANAYPASAWRNTASCAVAIAP